ncbi:hypothetical protein [Ferrimonas pelagia]|uniref:Uncharacterized protein n=1 Tax=Ferrimonas pelagia TaxID=1177826 RepID=A0ABP9EMG0_9GAMM
MTWYKALNLTLVVALICAALYVGDQLQRHKMQMQLTQQQITELRQIHAESNQIMKRVTQYQVKPAKNLDTLSHAATRLQLRATFLAAQYPEFGATSRLINEFSYQTLRIIRHQIAYYSSADALMLILDEQASQATPEQARAIAHLRHGYLAEFGAPISATQLTPYLSTLSPIAQALLVAHGAVHQTAREQHASAVRHFLALPLLQTLGDSEALLGSELRQQQLTDQRLFNRLSLATLLMLLWFIANLSLAFRRQKHRANTKVRYFDITLLSFTQELQEFLHETRAKSQTSPTDSLPRSVQAGLDRLQHRFTPLLQLANMPMLELLPAKDGELDLWLEQCLQSVEQSVELNHCAVWLYCREGTPRRLRAQQGLVRLAIEDLLLSAAQSQKPEVIVELSKAGAHQLHIQFEHQQGAWPEALLAALKEPSETMLFGLGLTLGPYLRLLLTLKQVELAGGECTLSNHKGGGRAEIFLPVTWHKELAESPSGQPTVAVLSGKNAQSRAVLSWLNRSGYPTFAGSDLHSVAGALSKPDVSALIIAEPRQLSSEALQTLRKRHPSIPLLVCGDWQNPVLDHHRCINLPLYGAKLRQHIEQTNAADERPRSWA